MNSRRQSIDDLLAAIDDVLGPDEAVSTEQAAEAQDIVPEFASAAADIARKRVNRILTGGSILQQIVYVENRDYIAGGTVSKGKTKEDAVMRRLIHMGLHYAGPQGDFAGYIQEGQENRYQTSFQKLGAIALDKEWAVIMAKRYRILAPNDSVLGNEFEILGFSPDATEKALEDTGHVPDLTIAKFATFRDELAPLMKA